MVKMILTVPAGFDAVKLLNVASELYRARFDTDFDIDLGDFASLHFDSDETSLRYEVDAELVDFRMVAILDELQELCPLVGKHFEQDGSGETYTTAAARLRDLGYMVIDTLDGDIDDPALAHMYREG